MIWFGTLESEIFEVESLMILVDFNLTKFRCIKSVPSQAQLHREEIDAQVKIGRGTVPQGPRGVAAKQGTATKRGRHRANNDDDTRHRYGENENDDRRKDERSTLSLLATSGFPILLRCRCFCSNCNIQDAAHSKKSTRLCPRVQLQFTFTCSCVCSLFLNFLDKSVVIVVHVIFP